MNDLDEQIWREEVARWADDTLAMWKTQYRLWQRAHHQGAPASLLNELSALCEHFKGAHERLVALLEYFPVEGKN